MKELNKIMISILNSFFGIVLFIVSFAAFYLPYELRIIPSVAGVLMPVRMACGGLVAICFLLLYISNLRVFRDNWVLWAGAGFILVLIFSTKMNGGDMEGALGTYGLCGFFLILDVAVFFKVNPKRYMLIAFFMLFAVNMANTYTVYEYCLVRGTGMWEEYGLYTNWFYSLVGNYNGGIEYVLPMAICGSAFAHRYGIWLEIFNYIAMIISLVTAVSCESVTQVTAFAIIIGLMIVADIAIASKAFARILKLVFQPAILVGIDFAVFVLVVVINKSNWVARLGIDPDFHNRRHIWNMSMEWISANPIWGNGHETIAAEAEKITGYAHSHCTYLEVAYKTGFVGTVFMILMLAAAIVSIYKSRHSRLSFILSGMLFVLGLSSVAETYPVVYLMLCFGFIYYISNNTNISENIKNRAKKLKPVQ